MNGVQAVGVTLTLHGGRTWRLMALLLGGILVSACADAPTSPTGATGSSAPPAVNLTGTWQGQYLEVSCQSTTCLVCCSSRGKTERRRDLQLVITQVGAAVTGLWREAPLETQGTLGGSIGGAVSGTSVALSGTLFAVSATASPVPAEPEPWRLTEFSAQAAGPSAPLAGSFALVAIDASGRETMRIKNDIVTLTRLP